MNTITTKYGTFNVTDNGKNGTIICIGNVKIAEFPNVSWWDFDSLEKTIGENIELIEKRIEERVNGTNVIITKSNALQVLEQLTQCMNKLKSVA